MSTSTHIKVPENGSIIKVDAAGKFEAPDDPIICFIEGDGIGVDITPVMRKVVDAVIKHAYGTDRSIVWMEIYAGEKAQRIYGEGQYLPAETLDAIEKYHVTMKGPLATPIGGGFRSLNVTIRQHLQLYACVRPVRYFPGVTSPLRYPERTDMVIFRENTEDIYLGVEFEQGTEKAQKFAKCLRELGVDSIPFPETTGYGVKPVSREGTYRLVRRAIKYALDNHRRSVTIVHKGNIMKFTEGAFRNWGYDLAQKEFGAKEIDGGPWCEIERPGEEPLRINDFIADNFLQKIIIDSQDFDVIATMNLNGDYISDALAAQVGGIGIAPGANLSDTCAVFEATHGTAPKHTGMDDTNPGSLLLSADMMLRHIGWVEAADLLVDAIASTIKAGTVTYDLAKGRDDAIIVPSSKFGEAMIENLPKAG